MSDEGYFAVGEGSALGRVGEIEITVFDLEPADLDDQAKLRETVQEALDQAVNQLTQQWGPRA